MEGVVNQEFVLYPVLLSFCVFYCFSSLESSGVSIDKPCTGVNNTSHRILNIALLVYYVYSVSPHFC